SAAPITQQTLARPPHPCHHPQHPESTIDVDVSQVVGVRIPDPQLALRRPHPVPKRGAVTEVAAGDRVAVPQSLDVALESDGATVRPRTRRSEERRVGKEGRWWRWRCHVVEI